MIAPKVWTRRVSESAGVAGCRCARQDFWSPAGKKRPPKGDFKTDMFSSGTMCVGSDLPVVGTV
jgi:hypothetical protein